MTFLPSLPLTGPAGWTFLKRTEAAQSAAFARQPQIVRDEAYFRDRIGSVRTAEELTSDRRLLRISLEAFGLEGDLQSTAFLRKVLEGGTLTTGALANKLADPRYAQFSAAFGFGDFKVPKTALSDFPETILQLWKERRFEAVVGEQNTDLRLAMNARRELATIARGSGSETTKWLRVLGNLPLRRVMEGAFALPQSFAAMDIDRQLSVLRTRTGSLLGGDGISQLTDPAKIETLIQRYLVTAQTKADPAGVSAQNPAVILLQTRMFRRL